MSKDIFLSWSGGKDSSLALYEIQKADNHTVAGLLTTITPARHSTAPRRFAATGFVSAQNLLAAPRIVYNEFSGLTRIFAREGNGLIPKPACRICLTNSISSSAPR
jgi:diphthamide synthase (EF-2-diphthine--ammonia ligase)